MKINTDDYRSPPLAMREAHDWRREPWFKDVSDVACLAGLRIAAALQVDGGDDEQATEDRQVMCLLNPEALDPLIRSRQADEVICYRLAHAISMCIEITIKAGKLT